ncbi:MAG: hypothetical protein HXX11_21050 [Desulfuromonadales bacterium]|nr:hypothetical protein [Desulfuromonadales bacterium]
MTLTHLLLFLLMLTGLYAVLSTSLIKAAIGLAAVSAILTMLMFTMNSPLAAVFELSVCAGLITVVFVSVISLTKPSAPGEQSDTEPHHYLKYAPLLVIGALLCWAMQYFLGDAPLSTISVSAGPDVRIALWTLRRTDIFAQLAVLFVGVYGVIVLFKELKHD